MKLPDLNVSGENHRKVLSPVLDKLVQLIYSRYACELTYRELSSLSPEEVHVICSATTSSPLEIDGRIAFPISMRKEIVGVAQVKGATSLCERSLSALRDVIAMALESTLLAASSYEVLEILEQQLDEKPLPTNLVHLSQAKSYLYKSNYITTKNFNGDTTLRMPFVIESSNYYDTHKMAVEIHEQSRRYAFIQFDQLNLEVRTSFQKINEIGNVTLFIPNISSLKDFEIFSIIDFYKSERTKESPQFIVGSLEPLKKVIENRLVPQELVSLLSVGFLRMNKSFAEYKAEGVTNFLFDSMTQPRPHDLI